MTIKTEFHARDTDSVTAHDSTIGGAFISATRGETRMTVFMTASQARSVHDKLGQIIAEQDAVAAAKASLRAA